MKTYVLPVVAATLLTLGATAQTGQVFPSLKGETMKDKNITVPDDTKGKFSILCLAYSEDAETDLHTWFTPMYDKFIAKTGLIDSEYDINLYFVPMFTGAKAAAAGTAKKKIIAETDPELQPYILLYKGDLDTYKTALKMNDKDKPYIFLLDATGKIVYATSGAFDDDKLDNIEDKLTD